MFGLDILIFTKLMICSIIWRKKTLKKLNSRNNGYIYGICNIIKHVLFLDYTRFGFKLVNQKMFEMKILKMTHFTYLVIFHLKVLVC